MTNWIEDFRFWNTPVPFERCKGCSLASHKNHVFFTGSNSIVWILLVQCVDASSMKIEPSDYLRVV